MSLILEALKKLERDKQVPDRGFLVLAHLPWVRSGRGRLRAAWMAVLALVLVVAGVFLWRARVAPTPPAAVPPPNPPLALVPAGVEVTTLSPAIAPPALPAPRPATEVASPGPSPVPALSSPSPAPAPAAEEFRLNAITTQDGHPVAVLNDRIVREGDSVDGVLVVRIGETEVEIEVKGKRRVLRF